MTLKSSDALALAEKVVFKKPVVPVKRRKKQNVVLEEEDYLEEMGKIIQKDFFPDLERMKAQNEYLDAVNKNDMLKLREIYAKYGKGSRMNTDVRPYSPATFETPADLRSGNDDAFLNSTRDPGDETPRSTTGTSKPKLSLDQYLANHTSEDNQSFEDIIEESEKQHRKKFPWLYKEDGMDNESILEKQLALPSIDQQALGFDRPLMVDMWKYKDKNYVMYVPDGVDLTPGEKIEMAKARQEITHINTRFKSNPFDEAENKERIQDLAHVQARSLDGKIGVDGKELVSDTPKVNGYGFVKTPSPAPGIDSTPLMTWGEIEGTPFRLDAGDTPLRNTPGPSYSMPEPPTREKIAMKLADKASESSRNKKRKAIETARRQLTSPLNRPGSLDRLQMLSPAARRMSSRFSRMSTDKSLNSYYSPSRTPTNLVTTPQIKSSVSESPVPQSSSSSSAGSASTATQITTDNLLNLNVLRRPRASDFFS